MPSALTKTDNSNLYISSKCKRCQSSLSTIPNSSTDRDQVHPSCERRKEENSELNGGEFQNSLLVLGGDWAWIATILGLSGARGLQFCKDCLCKLSDLEKGKTHTPNPLSKYNDHKPSKTDFEIRTFEMIKRDNQTYDNDGKPKSKLKEYNNCEFQSLFTGEGPILHTTSCMPLHISLGVGLKILNVIEGEAIKLDNEIKQDKGLQTDPITDIMEEMIMLLGSISEEEEKLQVLCEEKQCLLDTQSKLEKENISFLAKEGKKFVETSSDAKHVQKQYSSLKHDLKAIDKHRKQHENSLSTFKKQLVIVEEKFEKEKGYFQNKFDCTIDSMDLQRKVYHSGAIVGDDIHRLTRKDNICKISQVFEPKDIELADGQKKTYSTHTNKVKIKTLLNKFSQCFELYSVSRPLCKHEVLLLGIRCASLGCWFPVKFPESSIIPKFHCLTYHMPEKAKLRHTVGMEAENCSESIHPMVNSLNRTYSNIKDKQQKLSLICKSQWLKSNRTLPNFRKTIPEQKTKK